MQRYERRRLRLPGKQPRRQRHISVEIWKSEFETGQGAGQQSNASHAEKHPSPTGNEFHELVSLLGIRSVGRLKFSTVGVMAVVEQ